MPDDSSGIYSVPAGTIVSTGDTILPSQHNPWANDSASAISARFSKDGRAPATGNWNLNNFRITGIGAPVAGGDAVNKTYADGLNTVFSSKGHIFGLTLSNNVTDPTNDVDVAVGEATSDSTIPYLMALAAPITKRLDAAWAVGSGNGGLDTGSIANGTYHVWLIQRSDTGVVDALFSTSATSPTMPTNYDRKRRIGSIVRVSGAIKAFKQDGDRFMWSVGVLDVSAANPGTSAVTRTLTVPTGVRVAAILQTQLFINAATTPTTYLYVSDLSLPDEVPSSTNYTLVCTLTGVISTGQIEVMTDTSAQVRSRVDVSGTTVNIAITTMGFVDTRDRE